VIASSELAAEVIEAELAARGARVPFFMTPQVRAALGVQAEVAPSPAALAKFRLTAEAAAQVSYFAVKYQAGGKRILLLRIPRYTPVNAADALSYLRALLDEQQPQVDALVLDQTHNPGGNLDFLLDVASLLAPRTFDAIVQQMNADRLWISGFAEGAAYVRQATRDDDHPEALRLEASARAVDAAYSAGRPLSPPLTLGGETTYPADPAHWTKPFVVLSDELSVSCGDLLPALVKQNGMGLLFGQRTMGGGGNVELAAFLPNTQGMLRLTRGVMTVYRSSGSYAESDIIEDNGVLPDVTYSHTLTDFRAGYVGYVQAFNAALLSKLP
jgi:C-terminal processing protease CtpA/Prc